MNTPTSLEDAKAWVEKIREARQREKQIAEELKASAPPKQDKTALREIEEYKAEIAAGLQAWAMAERDKYFQRFAEEQGIDIEKATEIAQWTDGKHFLPSAMSFGSKFEAEITNKQALLWDLLERGEFDWITIDAAQIAEEYKKRRDDFKIPEGVVIHRTPTVNIK